MAADHELELEVGADHAPLSVSCKERSTANTGSIRDKASWIDICGNKLVNAATFRRDDDEKQKEFDTKPLSARARNVPAIFTNSTRLE